MNTLNPESHLLFFPTEGNFFLTQALIPEGFGALCANFIADLARFLLLTGKLPTGLPPAGPQKLFLATILYLQMFDPPGFALILAAFFLGISIPLAIVIFLTIFIALWVSCSRV